MSIRINRQNLTVKANRELPTIKFSPSVNLALNRVDSREEDFDNVATVTVTHNLTRFPFVQVLTQEDIAELGFGVGGFGEAGFGEGAGVETNLTMLTPSAYTLVHISNNEFKITFSGVETGTVIYV